ncbi:MAG: hypothetical protein CL561_06105 [Alphaproteobacteria bacterium]|nr:hypothetical protein [Alphaproteobacteria bacterium]|tara:strand:- start:2393 stop:3187 length:795 start_codon:yes stop_codon:yes gene_type:complete
MTDSVVLSSSIRTSLLQQNGAKAAVDKVVAQDDSSAADSSQVEKMRVIEDSFTSTRLSTKAQELGAALDTISQGLNVLHKTQEALHGLGALLRSAADIINGDLKPAEMAKALNENTEAIDDFISASEYAGINLLDGDEISIITNDSANPIVIEGRNYDAGSLGLGDAKLTSEEDKEALREAIRFALDSVQNYSVIIRDYLNTVETRHNFTQNTIDVLKEAASGVEVKDLSEEGVNLLALQTRIQLSQQDATLATPEQSALLDLF